MLLELGRTGPGKGREGGRSGRSGAWGWSGRVVGVGMGREGGEGVDPFGAGFAAPSRRPFPSAALRCADDLGAAVRLRWAWCGDVAAAADN